MNIEMFRRPTFFLLASIVIGTGVTFGLLSLVKLLASFIFNFIIKIHVIDITWPLANLDWLLSTITVVSLFHLLITYKRPELKMNEKSIIQVTLSIATMPVIYFSARILNGQFSYINGVPQPFSFYQLLFPLAMLAFILVEMIIVYGFYKLILSKTSEPRRTVSISMACFSLAVLLLSTYVTIRPCCYEYPPCPKGMSCSWAGPPPHREGCYECSHRDFVKED